MGSLGLCTLGATPRVAALSLREALRLREAPVAHKSHGAVRLSVQNTLREKRLALARRSGKSPGPLMAARRCDGRHIKQALSPHQGGGDMGRGAGGGEWYLRQC